MKRNDSCKLLGPVSIAIQTLMGSVVVCSLLIKRQNEHPKRTWLVWSYDVGKQVLGALSIHFLNLLLSVLKAGNRGNELYWFDQLFNILADETDPADQCDWYFLNLLIDTTLGIPVLWCCLTVYEYLLKAIGIANIESGNYYSDKEPHVPTQKRKPLFFAFLKQLAVFIVGLASMKVCLFFILIYFESFAQWFADWVLGWSDPWPNLQVFLVMFVFPVLLNCFQGFCVDSIIKLPNTRLTAQNVDNFDQESIMERNGSFVSSTAHKNYGSLG